VNRRHVIIGVATAAVVGAVGEVGVSISSSGEVCPEVSTQDWVCVHLG
jgi:hypothetical protein